jgi:hypothetical protein
MHNTTQIEVILWIEAWGVLKCSAENQGFLSLLRAKAHVLFNRPAVRVRIFGSTSLKRLCRTLLQPELSLSEKSLAL